MKDGEYIPTERGS